eukprot:5078331-Prymnesium_polylepis.1
MSRGGWPADRVLTTSAARKVSAIAADWRTIESALVSRVRARSTQMDGGEAPSSARHEDLGTRSSRSSASVSARCASRKGVACATSSRSMGSRRATSVWWSGGWPQSSASARSASALISAVACRDEPRRPIAAATSRSTSECSTRMRGERL